MRLLLLPAFLFMVAFSPLEAHAEKMGPKLIGALFYADWCGSCKTLDPIVEKAKLKAGLQTENILFVTLDHTDQITRAQSSHMAHALGLSEFYSENTGKTGFFVIFDAESGKPLHTFKKDTNDKAIAEAVFAELKK